jgi:hypothetical protein
MNVGIPRRLIQTGKSRDLSLREQAAVAGLRSLNPEFEYVFFDDADVDAFVAEESRRHAEAVVRFPSRIQKIDFFRYLAVYKLGGFYFDLDVFLARSLLPLVDRACVFPFEELTLNQYLRRRHSMDWEIGNYAFGAAEGHPFLKAVIQNCIRALNDPSWMQEMMSGIPRVFQVDYQVLNTTGPGLLSRTFAENPQLQGAVTVLFPEDVCDERGWHQFGEFGVHLQEGSWRSSGSYVRRRLANLWELSARRRGIAKSRQCGASRSSAVALASASQAV